MDLKLYAHGVLLVRCVWCVCDCCGEFNQPLYAHVWLCACARSGSFVAHGLGWTDDWDPKFGDDVGILQRKTVFYLSSDITYIGGSRGLRGLKSPLNFFRYVFWPMFSDTETSMGVIFWITFKWTISCTGIRTKILNAKLILLNLGSPNVFISL